MSQKSGITNCPPSGQGALAERLRQNDLLASFWSYGRRPQWTPRSVITGPGAARPRPGVYGAMPTISDQQ
jgi:hypothetical protein